MGRRALRTGDLVMPSTTGSLLSMTATPNGGDGPSMMFSFGLYIASKHVDAKRESNTFALVLDSMSMRYGWVIERWLKRVE